MLCPGGQLVPGAPFPEAEPKLEQAGYPGPSQCAVLLPPPLLPLPALLPDESDLELILLLSFEGVEDPDPLLLKDVELGGDAYTIVVVIELVSINVTRKRHKVNLTENLLFDFIL